MANETATANNPTDASASEVAATLLAQAGTETAKQTQTSETQTAPAAETKGTETKTTDKPAAEAGAKTTTVAPEKYEFKAPEGSEYAPEVLETFSAAAKEADLSQDAAQKLIEKMAPALIARQVDQVTAIQKEWLDASTADKEFGGEKLRENLGIAKRALDAFDPIPAGADANGKPLSTPLRALLDETGLGNHPEVLRFMFRAGKAISEDKFVGGKGSGGNVTDVGKILYPNTPTGKG
jgi:hypothetical protein